MINKGYWKRFLKNIYICIEIILNLSFVLVFLIKYFILFYIDFLIYVEKILKVRVI